MKPIRIIQRAPNPPLSFVPVEASNVPVIVTRLLEPATWKELHERALAHDGTDDTLWLFNFSRRIIGFCACQSHWGTWVKENPPRFNDYFAWTVEAHNGVNARLGKPILAVDEAKAIWTQLLPRVPGS